MTDRECTVTLNVTLRRTDGDYFDVADAPERLADQLAGAIVNGPDDKLYVDRVTVARVS